MSAARERRVLRTGRAVWEPYVVYGLSALVALGFEVWARTLEPNNPRVGFAVLNQLYANAALGIFVITLIARPIAGAWAAPLRSRRALGIVTFIFAAIHTLYAFFSSFSGRLDTILTLPLEGQIAAVCGTASLTICLALFAISNDAAMRLLRKNWAVMQRWAIPAFALALVHTLLAGTHFGLKPLHLSSALLLVVADLLFVVRALNSDRRRSSRLLIEARTNQIHASSAD